MKILQKKKISTYLVLRCRSFVSHLGPVLLAIGAISILVLRHVPAVAASVRLLQPLQRHATLAPSKSVNVALWPPAIDVVNQFAVVAAMPLLLAQHRSAVQAPEINNKAKPR